MNRNILRFHGTQMRDAVLSIYRQYPQDDANAIVRRMMYEIGETVSDLNSRKDAGQMLYAAADACTAKLPIDDFRLPVVAAVVPPAPAKPAAKPWREMNSAQKVGHALGTIVALLSDRFMLGFFLGAIVRGLR
jgi:hypothetical protein